MAEFNINCPHCGAELEANEEWIGMELECPACNKNFVVEKETPVEKASVPTLHLPKLTPQEDETDLPTLAPLATTSNTQEATEENSFIFVCPACGTQVELPVILKGKKYECKACAEESIAEATTEKKCPFCGKMIKIHATVCKHCKKDVTNAPLNMPPPKEETFPYFCPECDTFVELPVSMNGKKYKCKSCCEMSIAKPATERKCPACGEMIKIKAAICKHCKRSVPPLMGNNAINLQPIGNSAINLQPIGNKSNSHTSLQSIQPCQLSMPDGVMNPELELESLNTLFRWWWICLAGSIITLGLSFIASCVFMTILLYRYWKLIPEQYREGITPAKAIGFLFIPGFSLYWMYVFYVKLGKKLNMLTGGTNRELETMPLIMCICTSAGVIPYVGLIAAIPGTVFLILTMINCQKAARKLLQINS